jgi:hypothetical protein
MPSVGSNGTRHESLNGGSVMYIPIGLLLAIALVVALRDLSFERPWTPPETPATRAARQAQARRDARESLWLLAGGAGFLGTLIVILSVMHWLTKP